MSSYLLNSVIILVVAVGQAHAYIDPGSGSMFLQTSILVILGFGIAVRKFIFSFFRSFKKPGRELSSGPTKEV
jgi:hypothetical protein